MKLRFEPVLVAVIIIGLVFAFLLNLTRHRIEQNNNTVEMAMEYEGLLKLAALEGLPEETVLRSFKEAGINSLMVFDTTLERLSKKRVIHTATGEELRKAVALGADTGIFKSVAAEDMEENAVYIASGTDKEAFEDLREDLQLRYGAERLKFYGENGSIIRLSGRTEPLPEDKFDEPLGILQAPLGIAAEDLRKVARNGFNIIVRPQNYVDVSEDKIDSIFRRIDEAGVVVHSYMPAGKEVVGYPDRIDYLGGKMRSAKMSLIMLEHYTQLRFAKIEGLIPLAEAVAYEAARSYVIDPLEQKKISVDTALHRWALTDEERNIRVNYIRPFLMPQEGRPLMETNIKYVEDIVRNVKARGYIVGKAGVFSAEQDVYAQYFPDRWKLIPVAAGIIAAMVIYAGCLLDLSSSRQIWLWLLLTAATAGLLLFGRGLFTRQVLAFSAASFFPVLSIHFIMNIWNKNEAASVSLSRIILNGVWQLVLAVGISLAGAAFLSGILSDSRFLLEIDIYRGVKLTFILPVILTALLYVKRYDILETAGKSFSAVMSRTNKLLDTGLTFKHVFLLVFILGVAFYFVGRSGHTGGIPVPAVELKLRSFLEQVMYARPREKEFLVGHPAFFVAVFAAYRQAPRLLQLALACAAVIGQGSLVQTFCHMRTPVFMSFVRALDGYALGAILGIAAVCCLSGLLYLCRRMRRDIVSDE